MTQQLTQMHDAQLLQDYAATHSDEAFRALTDQYVGLVFSACLRQLRDRHSAEDATQAVFLLLSQKARSIPHDRLAGWLLTTARYACANIRKSETRRQRREQVAAMNPNIAAKPTNDLIEFLDDALAHLKSADREALVLRFLKEEPLSEIATNLGITEQAARKRVTRGMEKLRAFFARRGIDSSSAALAPILTHQFRGSFLTSIARQSLTHGILNVVQAGPSAAAASIAIAKGTNTMMLIAKLKLAAVALAVAAAFGTTGWMISHALAQKTPLVQAAPVPPVPDATPTPAPTSPPPAPAAAPATQPVFDLSTPDRALNSFFCALAAGNRDAAYRCLPVDPNRPLTVMDAVISSDVAQNHLTKAAVETYGGDGSPVLRLLGLESVAKMFVFTPAAQIDGNSATMTTPQIPQSMLSMVPPQFQKIVRAWCGAKVHFLKQSDGWKFDIDHTMRVALKIRTTSGAVSEDPALAASLFTDEAQLFEQTASDIRAGQYATIQEVSRDLDEGLSQINDKNGIINIQATVLPATPDSSPN